MEYAAGGELFDRISSAGRFSEAEVFQKWNCVNKYTRFIFLAKNELIIYNHLFYLQARYFFQQLICGVYYSHAMVNLILIHTIKLYDIFVLCVLLMNQINFAANMP